MSDYICIVDRSGADIDLSLLRRLAEPLRGCSGELSELCRGAVGIAVKHGHSGCSSTRDQGPVIEPGTDVIAALSGKMHVATGTGGIRCDDANQTLSALQALDAFRQRDTAFLANTSGAFAFMVADPGQRTLTVVRDHLGSMKVYWYLDRQWIIAASEPSAILRHAAVSGEIDERSVARFLGFRFSHTTDSFFRRIRELAPAHWLRVTAHDSETGQYWRFNAHRDPDSRRRERVCAKFLSHLGQSVNHQTADLAPERIAVSLSGGLDSTAVAALSPPGSRLCSWYFQETPECDERRNIQAVSTHLERPVIWVRGDGLYPLSGEYIDHFVHENSPHLNAFASLKRGLYLAAREAGCERVLVGDGGDVLYSSRDYWLRDMLCSGHPGAARSLAATVLAAGRGGDFARLSLRRLLPVRYIRATFSRPRSPWLTDTANAILPDNVLSPILPAGGFKYRFDPGVGAKHIEVESEERRLFIQCGVERGNPFWHWPLLESALNLPAWWLYRNGCTKVLTREAMKGLLPDQVRNSPQSGLLGTFFLRGIELNKTAIRETVFRNPRSDWQRYVKRSWLEPYLSATNTIAFGHTILWRVISYELWCRRLTQ